MICRRQNFQLIYGLRDRVFAHFEKQADVSLADTHDQFVLNTVQALGVTKAEWIRDYFRLYKADVNAALKRLEKQDRLMTVAVEGWKAPGYIHPDNLKRAEAAANGKIPRSKTTFLSPFDPLVWDRQRV